MIALISWLFRVAMISMRTLSSVPAPWKRVAWWVLQVPTPDGDMIALPCSARQGGVQVNHVAKVYIQQMAPRASRKQHEVSKYTARQVPAAVTGG